MVLKELIFTVSTLGGCGSLERTDFSQFLLFCVGCGGCGNLERTDFSQFLYWEAVVVLKKLIFSIFIWDCGGLEKTDF